MSDFYGQKGSFQPLTNEEVNNTSRIHDVNEENVSELKGDVGTPLDDEPELGDTGTIGNFNVLEEAVWPDQTSRPNSSTAATPTQDDNVSPEDISRIPVPTTGTQFISFGQTTALTQGGILSEASDPIGNIPLPQVRDDGSDEEIAIVDAISNTNAIPTNISKVPIDKSSNARDVSDHEIEEQDEFGRDMSRRRKGAIEHDPNQIVTIEEVSDDDLPEIIEQRTEHGRDGEERISDAESNYSMVSNNSLSENHCNPCEKEKRTNDNNQKTGTFENKKEDEISSLSGLSSEDEARESDRLQVYLLLAQLNFIGARIQRLKL